MRKVFLSADQNSPSKTFYAEEAYGLALGQSAGATWSVAADKEGLWSLPVMLAPIEGYGWEASSPYGYPGIFADRSLGNQEIAEFWAATLDALRENGVVSLFLRFPPYSYPGLEVAAFSGLPGLELKIISQTIEVPTDIDADGIWTAMAGRARTAVRKAEKLGMTAQVVEADESSLGSHSSFRQLYGETMRRIGAATHHVYESSYYSTLVSRLKERIYVVEVRNSAGRPAACAMILTDDRVVHYHLSGSNPPDARSGANNLLLWTILRWASDRGYKSVHLGGGLTANDPLFKFKESFGGHSRDFTVGRVVVNAELYNILSEKRAQSLGISLTELRTRSFFPVFRAEL